VKGPEGLDFTPDVVFIGDDIRFRMPAHDAVRGLIRPAQ
jgi:hypothetical protein